MTLRLFVKQRNESRSRPSWIFFFVVCCTFFIKLLVRVNVKDDLDFSHQAPVLASSSSVLPSNDNEDDEDDAEDDEKERMRKVQLDKFSPRHGPIVTQQAQAEQQTDRDQRTPPVHVRILLFEHSADNIRFGRPTLWRNQSTDLIGDEVLNIAMDGFDQSPYFTIVDATAVPDYDNFYIHEDEEDHDHAIYWVVDMRRMIWRGPRNTLHQAYDLVRNSVTNSTTNLKSRLTLIFMDWSDKIKTQGIFQNDHIKQLVQILGPTNVRVVPRQIMTARRWDDTRKFVVPGRCVPPDAWKEAPTPIVRVPYKLRTDYVTNVLQKVVQQQQQQDGTTGSSIPETLIGRYRTVDVAHFWPPMTPGRHCDSGRHCDLRNHVTSAVLQLQNQTYVGGGGGGDGGHGLQQRIKVFCDHVAATGIVGRTSVQEAYVDGLMDAKIVVVAQRDEWEDHYRFFEGIVGGALVMTDPMLTLPDGYKHQENIIVYHDLEELKKYIMYYLEHDDERKQLALKGWKLAMNRHRTFHAMEELFFGKPLTNTSVY